MSDIPDDATAEDVFGEAVPGEAVTPRHSDPLAGYQPRRRWVRSAISGRSYTDLRDREPRETTLPASYCSSEEPKGCMPNINDSFPSTYLKASDLQGRQVVVTMDKVAFEPVGRDREMKAVLYFIGKEKGVVLNKTNAKKITEIAGSALTEEWQGVAVVLYPTETEFAGESVECLRIKAVQKARMQQMTPAPPPPKPEPLPPVETGDNGYADINDGDIPF